MGKDKYLVNLLSAFTEKQLFFGVWSLVVGACVALMLRYYKKNTRRGFRQPGDSGPQFPVDLRRLDAAPPSQTAIVNKQNVPPNRKG